MAQAFLSTGVSFATVIEAEGKQGLLMGAKRGAYHRVCSEPFPSHYGLGQVGLGVAVGGESAEMQPPKSGHQPAAGGSLIHSRAAAWTT